MATALKSMSTERPQTLEKLVKTHQEITGWLVLLSLLHMVRGYSGKTQPLGPSYSKFSKAISYNLCTSYTERRIYTLETRRHLVPL